MIEVIKVELEGYGEFHCLHHNGLLLRPVNDFLIKLAMNGGRRGKLLATGSQRQYAYVMRQLFDYFEKNQYSWNNITSQVLHKYVKELDLKKKPKRNRINYMSRKWVEFYAWCTSNKIENTMKIDYEECNINVYTNDDFLAHTRSGLITIKTSELELITHKKRKIKYLSTKTLPILLAALTKEDIVYYAITYFMLTSGLRIGGALQLKLDSFPHFLEVPDLEWLDYNYVPKGSLDTGQTLELKYSIAAWRHICNTYRYYASTRAEKYFDKFGVWPNDFFLKENGMPVKDTDVWYRFRKISKKLKINITPHMMRHTFAVMFILADANKRGIDPTSKTFFWDAHHMLKDILGHVSIETTMEYCKAAYDYRSTNLLNDLAINIADMGFDMKQNNSSN